MEHSIFFNYDIGSAPWNALSKQDYIALAEWMSQRIRGGATEKLGVRVSVEVISESSVSDYTLDEFYKHFSTATAYTQLAMRAYADGLSLSCTFSKYDTSRHVYASGGGLTAPELEDISRDLKAQVESALNGVAPVVKSQPHHNGEDKPSETHPAESQRNSRKKFYQSGVFWTAVGAIAVLAVWILDRIFPIIQSAPTP